MQQIFDQLIDSYIETKVGIAEDFLSKGLCFDLVNNLNLLLAADKLHTAGTGNNIAAQDKLFRSDIIYWLDRKHNDQFENAFFDLIDQFVLYLNNTCYTGITGYEFHYALYEKGSFYKKHIDQFRNDESRKYSFIMYLNEDWQDADGGQLCIHHGDSIQMITPTNGRSVFFKSSELAHEVLLSNKSRMSITGWLKVDTQS